MPPVTHDATPYPNPSVYPSPSVDRHPRPKAVRA